MIDGADPATVYSDRWVRARKSHKCEECGRSIAAGERYHYEFVVYDRQADSYHTCEHCGVAQRWLQENCGGYLFGGIIEDIIEHANEYRELEDELRVLSNGMIARWRSASDLAPLPPLPRSIRSIVEPDEPRAPPG
jgi:DNA-directed RNA polymerase subunit RPC12/RpoP